MHQADAKFNETLSDNQDPHSNIENDETPRTEYPCENDSKDWETSKTSAVPNIMLKMSPNDANAEGISSLYSKQREVFNVVLTWDKDCVKYNGHNLEVMQIFISRSGGYIYCYI